MAKYLRQLSVWKWIRVLWLFFLVIPANAAASESDTRTAFENQIKTLAWTEKFDQLEAIVADLRLTHARWPDGILKMGTVYWPMGTLPAERDAKNCQLWTEKAQRWVDAKPESVTARIALASSYRNNGWKPYPEQLAKARAVLTEAEKLTTKDAALYDSLMAASASATAGWNAEAEGFFKKGVALDPGYYFLYFTKATWLMRRWGGQPGEWVAFAEEAAKTTEKEEGATLYARIVWSMRQGFGDSGMGKDGGFLARHNVSWPLLKQGFEDIEKRHPGSTRNLNSFCQFACMAGDRETAHALFKRIGADPDWSIWDWKSRVEIWQRWADPQTPKALTECQVPLRLDKRDYARSVAFSPDGKTVVAGYGYTGYKGDPDGRLVLWDVATAKPRAQRFVKWGISSVACAPDGQTIATGANSREDYGKHESEVTLWEASGRKIDSLPLFGRPIRTLAFSPDSKTLAIASGPWRGKGEVFLYDMETKVQKSLPFDFECQPHGLAFSPDGKWLTIGSWDEIVVWDMAGKKLDHRIMVPHQMPLCGLAFLPDGKSLISCSPPAESRNGHIDCWDLASGELEPPEFKGSFAWLYSVAVSPNGKLVAAAGNDGDTCLWEVSSGRLITKIGGHWTDLMSVAFSADGKSLVTASVDGQVDIWNVETVLSAAAKAVAAKKP